MTCSYNREVRTSKFISLFSLVFLLQLMGFSAHAEVPVDLQGNPVGLKNYDNHDKLLYRKTDTLLRGNQTFPTDTADVFEPYLTKSIGSWPEAVAIGDVNNDGRDDVVVTTSFYIDPENDYHLFVFLQNSSGGLTKPIKYPAGNGKSVDIADLNNDGRKDIVVTDSNSIGVFLQKTDGTLAAKVPYSSDHQSLTNTYKVRVGDFNNDCLTDVVSIDWGLQSHTVAIYLQNGTGTMETPVTYIVEHGGYDDLEVGDVNNDGLTDIIVMSGQTYCDNLGLLLQNSSGTFDVPIYYDIGGNELTHGVAVGDINNDSRQDVVVTYGGNKPSSFIAAFQQNSSAVLQGPVNYTSYDMPESAAIADMNDDFRKDVVVLHGGWERVGVYYQKSDGTLAAEVLYPIPYASHYNPHGLSVGDLNSDGLNDIAIADYNNGLVVLYNKTVLPPPPSNKVKFLSSIYYLLLLSKIADE